MATRAAWNTLPEEIVQVLGLHLDAEGWAAARSTCKGWSNIQSGIKLLEIDLERDAHRWMMVLTCVARLFPHLSCAILLVGNRISPALFQQRMEALAITGMKLQELELRFVYAAKPMIGSWLEDLSGVTHLRQLSVLRLAGGATPPPSFFAQLSGMRQLEVLELLPGAYGQALGDLDIDVASANAQGPVGEGGLADAHLEAIAQLTQLKKLTVKVIPGEVTPAGLNCLAASGLISQLRQLAIYDSELPAGCLSSVLKGAGRLTSLQLGLSNVDDLGALGKLPQLQELSLDAAFLPELRELVYAAARGNIPAAGPGALTGLCLLDQTITSAAQLAALSQLSSLAELVLVNPVREPLPPPEDDDTEDEQPAAAAAAAAAQQQQQQLQQQQQQDTGIDITALAGLAALRLLQVDLKPHPQLPDLDVADADFLVNPVPYSLPLQLRFSAAAVQQLAAVWTNLVTIDLSGFGPQLLPAEAVAGFSAFKNLQHLTIVSAEGVLGAEVQQQQQQQQQGGAAQAPVSRKVGWWQLPKGLASLCLSHFDLTGSSGSSSSSSSSSSIEQPCCGSSSSCCCCMAPLPQDLRQQQQQPGQQQRQYSPTGFSSRVQQLMSPGSSPLKTLAKRRLSQPNEQQQQQQQQAGDAGSGHAAFRQQSGSPTNSSSSSEGADGSSSSRAAAGVEVTAAVVAAAAAGSKAAAGTVAVLPQLPQLCTCVARAAAHFSGLQALWLEQVSLPRNLLAAGLTAAAASLESLALLQVSGTSQAELSLTLPGLTGLTSLRLLPSEHGLGGLGQLLPLRHLKKLNVKLLHLQPADLAILPRLRSLFCLALSAPLDGAGQLPPSAQRAPVKLGQVLDVVRDSLPYCDLELQAEAPAAGNGTA
uniref:F-box domain-containing protein n=1 Tax=Tetradesmus obliquus TaxID=3088 RepID=A0A383VCX0_TETOB|eukprot:jgi/Sobl393_1/15184/SZX63408.1